MEKPKKISFKIFMICTLSVCKNILLKVNLFVSPCITILGYKAS